MSRSGCAADALPVIADCGLRRRLQALRIALPPCRNRLLWELRCCFSLRQPCFCLLCCCSRADIGIAMGGAGSDAAIEAADVVIMDDQLSKIPAAMRISGFTHRIVIQNIIMALGVKALFLTAAALGFASIWGALFADVGVALPAIANAARILWAGGRRGAFSSGIITFRI